MKSVFVFLMTISLLERVLIAGEMSLPDPGVAAKVIIEKMQEQREHSLRPDDFDIDKIPGSVKDEIIFYYFMNPNIVKGYSYLYLFATNSNASQLKSIYWRHLSSDNDRIKVQTLQGLQTLSKGDAINAAFVLLDNSSDRVMVAATDFLIRSADRTVIWHILRQKYEAVKNSEDLYMTRTSLEAYKVNKTWAEFQKIREQEKIPAREEKP